MKTKRIIAGALLATLGAPFTGAYAQGSLTPPGAPAPTMKTLDQLEPRTPISTATTITQSGSYYLTTNIVVSSGNGITIYADEVTLDLNGFTIRSTAPSATGYGIYLSGNRRNIAIANGFIVGGVTNNGSGVFSGAGFSYGIYAPADHNVRVSGVSVAGCLNYGVYLTGDTTVADGCTVRTVGSYGIYAGTVKSSVVEDCGYIAIYGDQVSDCRGESVGRTGIYAYTVRNSFGYSSRTSGTADGIVAHAVHNSYGYGATDSGTGTGIHTITAENSYGYGAGSDTGAAYGIYGSTVLNSYGYGWSAMSYAYGIKGDTVQNSYGQCEGYGSLEAAGIYADNVHNSYGYCLGSSDAAGYGIDTYTADNCRGQSGRDNSGSRGIIAEGPVDTCYAYCDYATALEAESASNCRGESSSGSGIDVERNALNCVGISSSGCGLFSEIARNCYGEGAAGISATIATGCRGNGSSDCGIWTYIAQECYGWTDSGYCGIYSWTAQNCCGFTMSGTYGVHAQYCGIGCDGENYSPGGTGIHGFILNSCRANGAISCNYKYNMP